MQRWCVVLGSWRAAQEPGLATIGTVLPDGMKIAVRKMKGELSNGMLCAADELGLPADEQDRGLLILPPDIAAPGTPLTEALELHADVVFDIDGNRRRRRRRKLRVEHGCDTIRASPTLLPIKNAGSS